MRRSLAPLAALIAAFALVVAPSASAARLEGIDVSRFQGSIDWAAVALSGKSFAYVQASRGRSKDCTVKPQRCGPDELYGTNYADARAAGMAVGAYHRAFAGGRGKRGVIADAHAEAGVFVTSVGHLRRGDLLPALDVETPFGGLSPAKLRLWVNTWVRRVRSRLGATPVIYTNATSWAALGDTTSFARAGHPLWVANWGVRRPSVPADDWAGTSWSVWQYSSSGSVDGIDGNVDLDRIRGGLGPLTFGQLD